MFLEVVRNRFIYTERAEEDMKTERREALMRIPVGIVSGVVLGVWKALIQIIAIVHWIMVLCTAKRNAGLAEFCDVWNVETYKFLRYMTFVSNERTWPFAKLTKRFR